MLIIRSEQIAIFQKAAIYQFEEEMIVHLSEYSQKYRETLGEEGLRQLIKLGIDRAKCYEFTERGSVRLYLELMLMLGVEFDRDPLLPWALEFLVDDRIPDQLVRADLLFEKVDHYRKAIGGPDFEFYKKALHRACQVKFEYLPRKDTDIEASMLELLKWTYPEKFYYSGEFAVRNLIREAPALSLSYGFRSPSGIALFIAMMFAFGSGSAVDPRFPWITAILNQHSIEGKADLRAEVLYNRMIEYFDELLIDLKKG